MERQDVAYVINTTPKYFYLLRLHLSLLQRYAPKLQWPIYLATEEPEHKTVKELKKEFPQLQILPLTSAQEGFLESRAVATHMLPSHIQYVFPIQEDFLLEGRPDNEMFQEAFHILDTDPDVRSIRMMPCPGPKGNITYRMTNWKLLDINVDQYVFTYQATLWRRADYYNFINFFSNLLNSKGLSKEQKNKIAIHENICEVFVGQKHLTDQEGIHLAYPRVGPWPNAVYLCPWPYRPTAVVKGHLELWAKELGDREGVSLATGPSLR